MWPVQYAYNDINDWLEMTLTVKMTIHHCPYFFSFSEREKPSEAGFYAMIVSKIIDENFASTITMTTQLKNNGNYKEIYN